MSDNKKTINLCGLSIPDRAKIKIISGTIINFACVRYIDEYHFEMSNHRGEFNTLGSRVWHIAEYEMFCKDFDTKIEVCDD